MCVSEAQIGERIVSTERSSPTNNRTEQTSNCPKPSVLSESSSLRMRKAVRKEEQQGRRDEVSGEGE